MRDGFSEVSTEEMKRQLKERKLADRNKEREQKFKDVRKHLELYLSSIDKEALIKDVLSANFEGPDPNYNDEYSNEEEYSWEEAELEREWDRKIREMSFQVYASVLKSRLK